MPDFDYDVFLSFASLNEGLARPLYERLTGSGLRVFWSDEVLKKRVGQSWFQVIEQSLEASKHLVLLWTEEAAESKFVQMEYETFRSETIQDDDRVLIPLYTNGFGPEKMPLFMRHLQCYSLDGDLKDLISAVGGRYEPLEIQNAHLRKEIDELTQQIAVLKADRRSAQDAVPEHVQTELEDLKIRYARLEKSARKTTKLMKEKDSQLLVYEERIKELEKRTVKVVAKKPSKPKGPESDRYLTDENGIEFVLIEPGTFMMGSKNGEAYEKPVHKVELTTPFYLARYPVTQAQWQAIEGNNPSGFEGETHPVERVSWLDVQEYLKKLNNGKTIYRLPTEAEWEYACRAGTSTAYSFGDDKNRLGEYAWYGSNSNTSTHPVGEKKPNPWGLYDMHGNVWEWCTDWYADDYYIQFQNKTAVDPKGPDSGAARVIRGGSWSGSAGGLRSAYRNGYDPGVAIYGVGFRLLRTLP